jgi:lipopolysaccharide export system permease protein
VFGSILHRTVLFELVKVFALALVAIMSLLVMGGIVAEASQRGLKPNQILMAIPLLIPSFLPYTIPATTLFASCVVYGRLAHDNEILAIKAAGINVMKVVWPALFLGVTASALTMGLYYRLIPYTHFLLRAKVMNDIEDYLYDVLRRDKCIKQARLPYVMWVRQLEGRRLLDVLFKRLDKHDHYDVIARAQEADLRVDKANQRILVRMHDGEVINEDAFNRGNFKEQVWEVPLPPDLGADAKPDRRGLSWQQLRQRMALLRREIDDLNGEVEKEHRRPAAGRSAAAVGHLENKNKERAVESAAAVGHLANKIKEREVEISCIKTEMAMRPALSFGCLCFVLVGCPVGIWFSRSDYLSAFITCFLPIVFVYYPLLLCSSNYAKQGYPLAVVWASNAVMVLAGLVLFRQLLKH